MSKKNLEKKSQFLVRFFSLLEEFELNYVVLRNAHYLPFTTGGSDIDILFRVDDRNKVISFLKKFLDETHSTITGYVSYDYFLKVSFLGREEEKATISWWGQEVDLFFGLFLHDSFEYFNYTIIDKAIKNKYNIKVIPSSISAILKVIKELLNNKRIPNNYLDDVKIISYNDWKYSKGWLYPLGTSFVNLLEKMIFQFNNKEIKNESKKLKRIFLFHYFKMNPYKFLIREVSYNFKKIKRFFSPPGLLIAVLGTDGSGKSSLISQIKPILSEATHGAVYVRHLRPGLLPPLAILKGKKKIEEAVVTNPHGSTPSGILGSLFRTLYYFIDYFLGYWLIVRPKIAQKPAFFIFDRYLYDIFIDPRRFRIGIDFKKIPFFIHLIPKPDLIICLHGPTEIIEKRKKELPSAEIRKQILKIKQIANFEQRAVLLSINDSIDNLKNHALEAIFQTCKNKNHICGIQ